MKVVFEGHMPVEVRQEERWFIARCPLLDVYSQGESEKEALENVIEALSLFLISCFERGELDRVLKACGFLSAAPEGFTEDVDTPATTTVSVPIPFWVPKTAACHA